MSINSTQKPPKCKNPECQNDTYWRKGSKSMQWSTYCTKSCYHSHKSILMSKPPRSNGPKCKLPICNLSTNWDRGIGWRQYCSNKCQGTHSIQNRWLSHLLDPVKICNNPKCNNIVSNRNIRTFTWLDQCSTECKRTVDQIKIKITCKQKYGVENVMQSDAIFSKSSKSTRRFKDYIFPSGKIERVQGYESKALDELLKTYTEEEIICDRAIIPKFWYGNKKYYPDIYIPKDNLIIEVKSNWTYSGKPEWLSVNLLKEQATIAAGYKFKFMIY